MPFEKGNKLGGRNKSQWKQELEKAIIEHGETIGTTPFQRLAKLFYKSNDAAVGIANFFIPKLRTVEAKMDAESPFRLIITLPPAKALQEPGSKQIQGTGEPLLKQIDSKQHENAVQSKGKNKDMQEQAIETEQ